MEKRATEHVMESSVAQIVNVKKQAHMWRKKMNEAVKKQFIVHTQEQPDDAVLRCILGERCLHSDDADNALKHLGHAAKLGVKTRRLYTSLGRTHLNLGLSRNFNEHAPTGNESRHLEKAYLFFVKASRSAKHGKSNEDLRIYCSSAISMFQAGRYSQAAIIVSQLIEEFPTYAELSKIVLLGAQCAFYSKSYDRCVEYLNRLLLDAHVVPPYSEADLALLLSIVHRSSGDKVASGAAIEFAFLRSRAEYRRKYKKRYIYTRRSFASDPNIWYELGSKCMNSNDTVFAATCFSESLRVTGDVQKWSAETLYRLAKMYFRMNNPSAALATAVTGYHRRPYHLGIRACLLAWDKDNWKDTFALDHRASVQVQRIARGRISRRKKLIYDSSAMIQKTVRMKKQRKLFLKMKFVCISVQALWRGYAIRHGLDPYTIKRTRGATNIQRIFRGMIARRRVWNMKYEKIRHIVIRVQSFARRFLAIKRVAKLHFGALALQKTWRMHICRLYLYAIGVLPLVRWVQIGHTFIPEAMVRRDPTWEYNSKQKLWLGKPVHGKAESEAINDKKGLVVNGVKLRPNVQPVTYYNAVIAHRIQLASDNMKLIIERVEKHALRTSEIDIRQITTNMDRDEELWMLRQRKESDKQEVLKAIGKIENEQIFAVQELERARRRIAFATPRWLQKLAAAINDLKQRGHNPLSKWRARIQLHIESTIITLRDVHGQTELGRALRELSMSINTLSADMVRRELRIAMREGEEMETTRSREYRNLFAEFRAARRRAKRITQNLHALKRNIAELNAETKALHEEIRSKYGSPEAEDEGYNYFEGNKLILKPLETKKKDSYGNTTEEFLTEEGRLLARCRQLATLERTREDEDFLVGEFKRVLSQCANLGAWQIALKCHNYMAELNLVRDRKDYQNVLICLKKSKQHPYAIDIADAILEEMESLQMCDGSSITPYLIVMDGIAISELRIDPKNRSSLWRQALKVFQRLRKRGHKASTAVYEVLGKCCVRGAPDMVYEGLKSCGVPEYIAYSIAQKSLQSMPG